MSGTITKGADPAIQCALIKGQFAPKQMALREWRVAGFDGKSYQQVGTAPIASPIEVFFYGSQADFITWRNAIFAVVGEVVVIVNSDAFNSGNVLLKSITQPVITSGLPTYAVKASMTLTVETC